MIYNPGFAVGRLSGRAGSTVARANPTSSTLGIHRPRRIAPTPANQLQRASFSDISSLYKTLDPGQLLDWQALGQDIIISGRLQRQFPVGGRCAFFLINRNLFAIGQPYAVDAPSIEIPPAPADLAATIVTQPTGTPEISVSFTPDPVDADTSVIISATRPRSSSALALPAAGWYQMAIADDGDTGPYGIAAPYAAKFGTWFVGQQIGIQVVTINYAGFASVKTSSFFTST